jgi:predicted PurR-regulated permease PerM
VQFGGNSDRFAGFIRLATFVLVVAVLRFAQEVLLPVAFAGLLAFLLSPLLVRLMRWHLPKLVAIIVTVSLAFSAIGGVGWVVATQAVSLVRELPNYEENLHRKIAALKQPHTPAVISRIAGMIENLQRDLKASAPERPVVSPPSNEPKPVPVEVKPTTPTPWELARELIGPVLRPLGIAGIVIVFVVAMLFQREDLRYRFIKLVSGGHLTVATEAIDDAATRVSRYLGMQLVVNAIYGVPIGIALFFIGIPNALLWGLLATLLRFIPFLGPWIAAAFPVALALAVDPGWSMLLYTLGVFVVMELISNYVVELLLYGASTGISNLALLIAAVFWTWLWGPAGLVLSTPLTVCLLVIGKYVPGLNFLDMLLGSEPVLDPPAQFYQRMLSMESEDMLDLALKHIEEHSIEQFYEDVFVPALLMSEEQRHRGTLPELRQQFIFQASRELIEELERQQEPIAPNAESDAVSGEPARLPASPSVLIMPARDEADEIVALMLVHLLRRRGTCAAIQVLGAPLEEAVAAIDQHRIHSVVISALPPSTVGAARQLCRRLRTHCPTLPIVVGVWRHHASLAELNERLRVTRPDEVVTTLTEAIAHLQTTPASTSPTPFGPGTAKPAEFREVECPAEAQNKIGPK